MDERTSKCEDEFMSAVVDGRLCISSINWPTLSHAPLPVPVCFSLCVMLLVRIQDGSCPFIPMFERWPVPPGRGAECRRRSRFRRDPLSRFGGGSMAAAATGSPSAPTGPLMLSAGAQGTDTRGCTCNRTGSSASRHGAASHRLASAGSPPSMHHFVTGCVRASLGPSARTCVFVRASAGGSVGLWGGGGVLGYVCTCVDLCVRMNKCERVCACVGCAGMPPRACVCAGAHVSAHYVCVSTCTSAHVCNAACAHESLESRGCGLAGARLGGLG
eukprot:GHVU01128984.1.p1 GENE.GHVU01128984.1~~GHVU01128984.1.p1  ORF type:complete len:273 (+),score=-7.88 GHVU01128984.1:331-1149(+)